MCMRSHVCRQTMIIQNIRTFYIYPLPPGNVTSDNEHQQDITDQTYCLSGSGDNPLNGFRPTR